MSFMSQLNPWYFVLLMVIVYVVQFFLSCKAVLHSFKLGFNEGEKLGFLFCSFKNIDQLERAKLCSITDNGVWIPYDPKLDVICGCDPMKLAIQSYSKMPAGKMGGQTIAAKQYHK